MLEEALGRPVVQSVLALLRLRNTHPAFTGTFEAVATAPDRLALSWTRGADAVRLDVDLAAMTASLTETGSGHAAAAWYTPFEAQA